MSFTSNVTEFRTGRTLVGKSRAIVESNSVRAGAVVAAATLAIVSICCTLGSSLALAASASEIDRNATQSLKTLYQTTPGSKALANKAKGILIFPNIVKGGFIVAGQF